MDELTRIAVVGTSRSTATIASEYPAGALVTGIEGQDRESLLLLHSGAQAIYELAGRKPFATIAAITPAEPESGRIASRKLAALLANAIVTNATDLLVDFLRQMQGSRLIAPPDLLPALLDCADLAVRQHLLPVLGERGKWLSRQNPNWSWVFQGVAHLSNADQLELKRIWDEGKIAERCQVISTLRRSEPERAREWLAAAFSQEKPAHRVSLLEEFTIGMSATDEPFLEGCLADRAASVQQVAARLLCCLPNSALAARMRERADAILSAETKGLLRKKIRLVCAPPEKIDRDWERDGIPAKAPSGRGLRAFWVETLLGSVPPSYWANKFGLAPSALIEAISDDEFEQAVLLGWSEGGVRFAGTDPDSAAWLTPLWNRWAAAAERMKESGRAMAVERLRSLLPAMTPNEAERGMLALFTAAAGSDNVESLGLLPLLPRPWSAKFAAGLLALVRQVLAKQSDYIAYQWSNVLSTAGRAIPAEVFPAALLQWQVAHAEPSKTWHVDTARREIDKFVETIETRQSFFAEVAALA